LVVATGGERRETPVRSPVGPTEKRAVVLEVGAAVAGRRPLKVAASVALAVTDQSLRGHH
jgi:hypothetical protein